MTCLAKTVSNLCREDQGASLPEYALLLALVTIVVLAACASLGTAINGLFNAAATSI